MAKNDTPEIPGLFDDLPEEAPQEQIAKISLRSWRTHLASIRTLDKRIEKLIDEAVKQALAQGRKLTNADIGRVFQRHPELRAALDKTMQQLNDDLTATIEQGSKDAWLRANTAADAVVAAMANSNSQLAALLSAGNNKPQNDRALRAFQQREMQGLKLSDRVWKATEGMKLDMERAIEVALAEGVPAQKLSERVRELLKEPHRLYRRVRDKDGNLKLSQAAQKYHPGTGVYRSSYKNAMRVARTEVNMAYQASDSERWTRSWWVKGIRVSLSNNHTCLDSKGRPAPLVDICDELAGDYPADFKFTGWHPQCRCFATAITCEYTDIRDYYRRKRAGEDMTGYTPPGTITEPPEQFKRWMADNSDRLAGAAQRGTTPYFIANNAKYTDPNWKPGKAAPAPAPRPKTPLEIADERHARRTAKEVEKIQRRWSTRQMNDLWKALGDRYLPDETTPVLSQLNNLLTTGKYAEFSRSAQPLIAAASRHRNRKIEDAMRIQQAWDASRGKEAFEREYESLCNFKTRSGNYRWFLRQAKEAYDNGDYATTKQYIDGAKYVKKETENKAAERIAEKAATIYKEPTPEEYAAAMKRNKALGVFSTEQEANNRALEAAMGIKQGDVMDWQTADKNNANPGYKRKEYKKEGYADNCQTCTMTYEARRRGFKITSAPSPGKNRVDPDNFYTFTEREGLSWRERFLNQDGTKPKPAQSAGIQDTPTACLNFIESNTADTGRYEVFCVWDNRKSSHVFIVERDADGKLLWIDPQTGKSGNAVQKYTESMYSQRIEVIRIDDKVINTKFASRMVKKTK